MFGNLAWSFGRKCHGQESTAFCDSKWKSRCKIFRVIPWCLNAWCRANCVDLFGCNCFEKLISKASCSEIYNKLYAIEMNHFLDHGRTLDQQFYFKCKIISHNSLFWYLIIQWTHFDVLSIIYSMENQLNAKSIIFSLLRILGGLFSLPFTKIVTHNDIQNMLVFQGINLGVWSLALKKLPLIYSSRQCNGAQWRRSFE